MFSLRTFRFVSGVGAGAGAGVGAGDGANAGVDVGAGAGAGAGVGAGANAGAVAVFTKNVASSVSPLPCVLRNMLENRSADTEVATTLCFELLCFGGDVASSVSPLPLSGLGPVINC